MLGARVADLDAHQEPVQLRLGQRVGALELDRVLRRRDRNGRGSGCDVPSTEH